MPNHNFIDMTGQTYNWVHVDSRAENNKEGRAMWNCTCLLCGKKFVAFGKYIRYGNTKSCGCYRQQVAHDQEFEDITGQQFQGLHVKRFDHTSDTRGSMWECECQYCGGTTYASTAELRSGNRKSCGCIRAKSVRKVCALDLKDKQYNYLIPREIVGSSKKHSVLWLCDCVLCGGQTVATAYHINSGKVLSCGCLQSKHEMIIRKFLEDHDIRYQTQKRFIDCKNKHNLMFDIYLPDYNLAIEYDGEFHYLQVGEFNDLEYQHRNDSIKTKYCEENDIVLLRIPYWEKDNIDQILKEWLFLDQE